MSQVVQLDPLWDHGWAKAPRLYLVSVKPDRNPVQPAT